MAAVFAGLILVLLASCATASAYVEGYEKNPSDYEVPSLFHEKVTLSEATVVFTAGSPGVSIPLADEDVIFADSSVVPGLRVEN